MPRGRYGLVLQRGYNVSDETKVNVLPIAMGGAAAVALAVGIFVTLPEPEPEPQLASSAPTVQETVVTPEQQDVAQTPDALDPVEPLGPQFDTFRVEADGSMVIAGRAEPGQIVDVMLAGTAIERVSADATGSFVAFAMAGPSDVPRRLILVADPDGAQLRSETSYIVAPISAPAIIAAPLEDPTAPESVDIAQADAPSAGTTPPLPDSDGLADAVPVTPTSPTVLQTDADGVRVVASNPTLIAPNVALDAITYNPEGDVQLAGRATGDGAIQVYIDNEPVTGSPVAEGRDWRIDLPDIDTGVYTLRIDEVDEKGDVVSRLETPFRREEATDVAAALADETAREGFEVAVKTVQPGATLWAIAEENFGSGIYYVEVFEANADLIRDPDLIYPGQIFRMPQITQ